MISMKQLQEISMKYLDAQSIELVYILSELENTIEVSDEILVYPKHLYQTTDHLELYLFTPNGYLIITSHWDDVTRVKTMALRSIEWIESTITDENRQLLLHFKTGETLSLNPNEDTTSIYRKEFHKQLRHITTYLHHSTFL